MSTGPKAKKASILVTCEHGGNRVPRACRRYFEGQRELLDTHRGYDPGALQLARRLARHFDAVLIASTVTRLLIDLNRSLSNRQVFSEAARLMEPPNRKAIIEGYYRPYRSRVEETIQEETKTGGRLIHISVHSFTPHLNGETRNADVGLLYDPSRRPEKILCRAWQAKLERSGLGLVVRRNYPYRGVTDGLTRHLRRQFDSEHYAGIELEVNQKWPLPAGPDWARLQDAIIKALAAASRAAW